MEAPKLADNKNYVEMLSIIVSKYRPKDDAFLSEDFELELAALTVIAVKHGQKLERYIIDRRDNIGGN